MARSKRNNPDGIWNCSYKLAVQYYVKNGHLLIPHRYACDNMQLGRWIGTQRDDYHKRTNPYFTVDRIHKLEQIGMVWDVNEAAWEDMFQALLQYKKKNGDIRVPQSYITETQKPLGSWINKQRMDYKKGKLLPERQSKLEDAGMLWRPQVLRGGQWKINFGLLLDYIKIHNGKFPPYDHVTDDGVKLGIWLANQRQNYLDGKLLPQRQKMLEDLGMLWDALDQRWDNWYTQAKQYFEKQGHLRIGVQDDKNLNIWLSNQRALHRKGKLTTQRVEKLNFIGMRWEVRIAQWETMYTRACGFYHQHGHLLCPKENGTEDPQLGQWLGTQRRNYIHKRNPYFTAERISKLEQIGMVWDASADPIAIWEDWYELAQQYHAENGHLCPPKGRLQTWILAQRAAKKGLRGNLTPDQIRRLEDIGMLWTPMEVRWQQMYCHAKEYFEIHGMLNIPVSFTTKDGQPLGQWIARQRQGYKNFIAGTHTSGKYILTSEHMELLNQINMIWDASTLTSCTSFQEKTILYYLKQIFPNCGKISRQEFLGYELDVYLPTLQVAVEYDGMWHKDMLEQDIAKNRACLKQNIRLVRIREPDLPKISECSLVIELEDTSNITLEKAIITLFQWLGLTLPDCDVNRDRSDILASYKDYVARKWDQMYEEVYQYHRENGVLHIPSDLQSRANTSISSWIYKQREYYKNDLLTSRQIEKLEKLGMVWEPYAEQWNSMYAKAVQYYRKCGDLMIPATYRTKEGIYLGGWLAHQREHYRLGRLDLRRIHLLERICIVWSPAQIKKNCYIEAAQAFYRKEHHLYIPAQYITEKGVRLGEWLCKQRALYRENRLDSEYVVVLEAMGVQWNVFHDRWEEMFCVAQAYWQQHGNLWISPNYITPDGVRLGGWISKQRLKHSGKGRHRALEQEQCERLNAIGMVWDPYTEKWLTKYKLAKAFYVNEGHLRIPVDYVTNAGEKLGMWLACQRQAMRGNPNFLMTEERKQLLEAIGMDWNLKFTRLGARQRE